MHLGATLMRWSNSIPPGRYEPSTGQQLHYLEVREGVLESQERHGSVLVRKDARGKWRPVEPRDGLTLSPANAQLGFEKDGVGVVSFEQAYPDRPDWELDLWADHARLTFHNGGRPSPPMRRFLPSALRLPRKKKLPKVAHADPLSVVSHRFVGLLERRIPTSYETPTPERREKILAALEPGDIILETNLAYPGWKQLVHLTMGSEYTHAAMYEGDGKFLEATPHGGVQRADLEKYFNDTVKLCIVEMPYASEADRQAAVDNFRAIRGKAYNRTPRFLAEEKPDRFGCTEAVTYVLENLPNPIRVPRTRFATGHEAVSPAAFLEIPGAVVKYDDCADYHADQAHAWPVGAIGLGVGVAADVAALALGASPVGAAIGGAVAGGLGYYLSVCVGNWVQKGRFGMFVDGK